MLGQSRQFTPCSQILPRALNTEKGQWAGRPAREGRQRYSMFALQGASMGAKCKTEAAGGGKGRLEGDPTPQKPGGRDERQERERGAGLLRPHLSQTRLGIFVQRVREHLCRRCQELKPLTYGLLPVMETGAPRTPPQRGPCPRRLRVRCHDGSRSTQGGQLAQRGLKVAAARPPTYAPTSSSSGQEPPDPSPAQPRGRAVPRQLRGPPAGWAGPGMPGGPGAAGWCWLLWALRQAGGFLKGTSASAAPPPFPGHGPRAGATGESPPAPTTHRPRATHPARTLRCFDFFYVPKRRPRQATDILGFISRLEQTAVFRGWGGDRQKRQHPCKGWAASPRLSPWGETAPRVSSASPLPASVGNSATAQDCKLFILLERKSLKGSRVPQEVEEPHPGIGRSGRVGSLQSFLKF